MRGHKLACLGLINLIINRYSNILREIWNLYLMECQECIAAGSLSL